MSITAYFKRKKYWIDDFFHVRNMWEHFKEIMFIMNNPEEAEAIRKKELAEALEKQYKWLSISVN